MTSIIYIKYDPTELSLNTFMMPEKYIFVLNILELLCTFSD